MADPDRDADPFVPASGHHPEPPPDPGAIPFVVGNTEQEIEGSIRAKGPSSIRQKWIALPDARGTGDSELHRSHDCA